MRITNINLKKLENAGRLKAVGSITFDDEFVIKGVSVVEGAGGLFISMPSKKDEEGKFRNIVFPISRELRELITKEVLAVYEKEKEADVNE